MGQFACSGYRTCRRRFLEPSILFFQQISKPVCNFIIQYFSLRMCCVLVEVNDRVPSTTSNVAYILKHCHCFSRTGRTQRTFQVYQKSLFLNCFLSQGNDVFIAGRLNRGRVFGKKQPSTSTAQFCSRLSTTSGIILNENQIYNF